MLEFLKKVEQSGKWPQQACTTMFFLIPWNVTSERPIALITTLIRWWEALRAPEVAKWQQESRVDWDATDGRNGGAQRTAWEVLMEMEAFNGRAKAVALGAGPCEDIRASQPSCGLGLALHQKILRVLCGYFEHQRRVQFEGCAAEPLTTITAILPGSKWSCLLLRIVLQDALGEVTKICPSSKLRVFVDDITAFVKGRNKDVAEMAKKGDEKVERRSGEKRSQAFSL